MSPVAAYGIQSAGLPATFVTLGTIDLAIITVAARFYVNPSPRSASEHTPGSESLPSPVATTARIERAHEYGGAEAVEQEGGTKQTKETKEGGPWRRRSGLMRWSSRDPAGPFHRVGTQVLGQIAQGAPPSACTIWPPT